MFAAIQPATGESTALVLPEVSPCAWYTDTVTRWVKQGYDIKMIDKADPEAKVHFDQMWDTANKAAQAARAAREACEAEAPKTTAA